MTTAILTYITTKWKCPIEPSVAETMVWQWNGYAWQHVPDKPDPVDRSRTKLGQKPFPRFLFPISGSPYQCHFDLFWDEIIHTQPDNDGLTLTTDILLYKNAQVGKVGFISGHPNIRDGWFTTNKNGQTVSDGAKDKTQAMELFARHLSNHMP